MCMSMCIRSVRACVCWVCMYGCLQVLEILNWDLKVVTASEFNRCILSQLPSGSRREVEEVSELLINVAQSQGDPIWWLGENRSSMALGAVMASLQTVGSHLPNLKEFVDLAGEQAVTEQYWKFVQLAQKYIGSHAQ